MLFETRVCRLMQASPSRRQGFLINELTHVPPCITMNSSTMYWRSGGQSILECRYSQSVKVIYLIFSAIFRVESQECQIDCSASNSEDSEMLCAFEINEKVYKMFPSRCAMEGYAKCHSSSKCWVKYNLFMHTINTYSLTKIYLFI